MTDLPEIEAALKQAGDVEPGHRTQAWHALVDSLLAERERLIKQATGDTVAIDAQRRSTRLLFPNETR